MQNWLSQMQVCTVLRGQLTSHEAAVKMDSLTLQVARRRRCQTRLLVGPGV